MPLAKTSYMSLFLLLCCSLCSFLYGKGQPKTFPEKWVVKISPLSAFDLTNPAFITGIAWRLLPALGFQAEYGFKCVGLNALGNKVENNTRYYKVKLDGRYYMPLKKGEAEAFAGLGYLAIPQRFEVQSYQYWNHETKKAYQVDGAKVRRNIKSIMARAGFYFHFPASRFVIETGFGIGPRFVSQHFYNEKNKIEIPEVFTPTVDWINPSYNKYSGTETRFNLECNLRIGWKLGKRLQ